MPGVLGIGVQSAHRPGGTGNPEENIMQVAHINTKGLTQIHHALGLHHKLGADHFTPPMLSAWAKEAEDHFNNGNGCYFEIRSFDSNSGTPVEVFITPDGYEVTANDD
jgi:hypothetical protein